MNYAKILNHTERIFYVPAYARKIIISKNRGEIKKQICVLPEY